MELSILIVTAQLTDSYIRWLAFSSKVSCEVKRRLWVTYFIWGVASFFVYNWIFSVFSISAATYKAILMLGWLPYFIIGTRFIPLGMSQHVFVLGMAMICAVVQHTVCAIIILNSFVLKTDSEIILFEAAVYLLLFALFLPICGRCFVKLLPSREFFNQRTIGIYIAVFPLIIVSGHLIRLADGVLVHSLAERISRIYLPVAFFFFYRYIVLSTNNFYAIQQIKRNQERLEAQLFALKEYNALIRENQKKSFGNASRLAPQLQLNICDAGEWQRCQGSRTHNHARIFIRGYGLPNILQISDDKRGTECKFTPCGIRGYSSLH